MEEHNIDDTHTKINDVNDAITEMNNIITKINNNKYNLIFDLSVLCPRKCQTRQSDPDSESYKA